MKSIIKRLIAKKRKKADLVEEIENYRRLYIESLIKIKKLKRQNKLLKSLIKNKLNQNEV